MKMVIAILLDEDSETISLALVNAAFRVTRIASTGGLFRRGSTTLMIGVAEDKVEEAIELIRKNLPKPAVQEIKRATLFVLNIAHFEQI